MLDPRGRLAQHRHDRPGLQRAALGLPGHPEDDVLERPERVEARPSSACSAKRLMTGYVSGRAGVAAHGQDEADLHRRSVGW